MSMASPDSPDDCRDQNDAHRKPEPLLGFVGQHHIYGQKQCQWYDGFPRRLKDQQQDHENREQTRPEPFENSPDNPRSVVSLLQFSHFWTSAFGLFLAHRRGGQMVKSSGPSRL